MKYVGIVGLRRSGNHILIEWVASNYSIARHHNDCIIEKSGKYKTQSAIQTYHGNGKPEAEIYSFEERSFDHPGSFLEDYDEEFDLLLFVLRDAYNWGASLMVGRGPKKLKQNIKLWKEMARLYLDRPERFILYDQMLSDPDYIQFSKDRLELKHANNSIPDSFPKSKIGDGSSFGKFAKETDDFLHREHFVDKKYKGKPPAVWKEFLEDPEIRSLNLEIFGRAL